jgi:hypothetical protein
MKELLITPELCSEIEQRNKPALLIISKMNVTFNVSAVMRLALKEKIKFQLLLKDGKLFYKEDPNHGFEIKKISHKGANFINKGLHILLCENFKKNDKSFRFVIGDFNEGLRMLTPIGEE